MNILLILGLLSQPVLDRFAFSPIQLATAGRPLAVTIVALDQNGDTFRWGFTADLTTSFGASYVSPNFIRFDGGVSRVQAFVYLATDSMRLICTKHNPYVSTASDPFTVVANEPARYVTLMPGEILNPGSTGTGRLGLPRAETAGVACTLTTYLTDNWFNPVTNQRNDTLRFTSTDAFAQFPFDAQMSNGTARLTATFRTAGTNRLFTASKVNNGIRADTSSQFSVFSGQFSTLVALLPGETLVPGDTATSTFANPGRKGGDRYQYVRRPFPVRVIGTDDCFNPVMTPRDTITLQSDFAYRCSLPAGVLQDTGTLFWFRFDSTGSNQTLWAYDLTRHLASCRTIVNVLARTESIAVTMLPVDPYRPETVYAGRTVVFKARFLDANAKPIPAKWVCATVTTGHGGVYDSVGILQDSTWTITDTSGLATIRFRCDPPYGAEEDSIEFSADGYSVRRRIYILADREVMEGNLIAYPNPLGIGGPVTTIEYFLPATADQIVLGIYDPFGNEVWRQEFRRGQNGNINGINRITWDGRAKNGRRVASGLYLVKVWGLYFTDNPYNKTYRLGVLWPN